MDPMATPYLAAIALSQGKSHFTCRATVGQQPVNACTCPASASFSSVVVAAASWMNFPKRVPVFENPQLGSSIAKRSKASKRFALGFGDGLVDDMSLIGIYTFAERL